MTDGKNKNKSFLAPLTQNLRKKLSNTDVRVRRKALHILLVIIVVFTVYSFFSGPTGFIRIARLHIQKNQLERQNHELLADLVDAEYTAKRLKSDMKFIEYIARTRHYFAREGEVIYRLKE